MKKINVKNLVQTLFKIDGKPIILTPSQIKIFESIYFKEHKRVEIIAPTQFGKSMTVSLALILRSQHYKEDWAIITGDQKKSEIIMGLVIEHLFDVPFLLDNLEIDTKEPLDRIRRERSKKRITWKGGGSITAITAAAHNRKRVQESLSGLGSPNIVEDESALIPDELQSMLLRMLGGYGGGHLIKIGNPYNRNHFYKTWNSPKYHKIFINKDDALREGRYTEEFIEEMRSEAFFDVLYECKFPSEKEIDIDGFRRLLTDSEIINAIVKDGELEDSEILKLGFDIGEGGDENVGVLRGRKYARIAHKSRISDLMATVGVIDGLIKKYDIEHYNAFPDDTGIGAGVVDRLHEIGLDVSGIKWAEKSNDKRMANLKAENYWELRKWIKEGGKLVGENENWQELSDIKYQENSSGQILIKSKEKMRKEGIPSPNIADALALTFNKSLNDEAPSIHIL